MKPLLLVRGRFAEQVAEKIRIAVFPIVRLGGTTQPAFLLQEVQEDQPAQKFFDEIADWFQRLVPLFFIESF